MSSINDKLERVRKPRVHGKYDVETEGAEVTKELPLLLVRLVITPEHIFVEQKSLKNRVSILTRIILMA